MSFSRQTGDGADLDEAAVHYKLDSLDGYTRLEYAFIRCLRLPIWSKIYFSNIGGYYDFASASSSRFKNP